jgi:hypothetical protein
MNAIRIKVLAFLINARNNIWRANLSPNNGHDHGIYIESSLSASVSVTIKEKIMTVMACLVYISKLEAWFPAGVEQSSKSGGRKKNSVNAPFQKNA